MNAGQFVKGNIPWNKDTVGVMKLNKTSFKKGNTPPQQKPKGYIQERLKKGKVDAVVINIDWQGNRKHDYSYPRYIWETYHNQDLPQGMVIYHKDGNNLNNEIGNLEAITRAELIRLNK